MSAVLIFVLLCTIGLVAVIDGKCDFIKNSSVSCPGFLDVPSGCSSTPKMFDFFFSRTFRKIFMESVELRFVLKSLQSCFFAFRQSFLQSLAFSLIKRVLSAVLHSIFCLLRVFNSFLWCWSLLVHHGLFRSLGLFFFLGQFLSIAISICA